MPKRIEINASKQPQAQQQTHRSPYESSQEIVFSGKGFPLRKCKRRQKLPSKLASISSKDRSSSPQHPNAVHIEAWGDNALLFSSPTLVEKNGVIPRKPSPMLPRNSDFQKLFIKAMQAGEGMDGSASLQTPTEVPSHFVHSVHVDVSKWSMIVGNQTLFHIAANNERIFNVARQEAGNKSIVDVLKTDLRTKTLLLNGATKISDSGLKAVARTTPTLQALGIAHARKITDKALRVVAEHCSQLKTLNLSGCIGIKGTGLESVGKRCYGIEELTITDCPHLPKWVLTRCFTAFTQLRVLDVSRSDQIEDTLLHTLSNHCSKLQSLYLTSCYKVTDSGITSIAHGCRKLQVLIANFKPTGRSEGNSMITDISCVAIGENCHQVIELNLTGCHKITDVGIKWIAEGCPRLMQLTTNNLTDISDASLRSLGGHCSNLRSFRFNNVKNISDVGLRVLSSGCPRLECLHASNVYLISDGSRRDFGLEGLQAVTATCKNLQEINLSGCFQVIERALRALGENCVHLRKVNLAACPNVTMDGVQYLLKGCPQLASLNLSGMTSCTNAIFATISTSNPCLKKLWLADCDRISDRGLRCLATCADQFELLDLSQCYQITDEGMNTFVDSLRKPALAHLILVGCRYISLDSISKLALLCPFLLTLSVRGCGITGSEVKSLSTAWPFSELRLPSGTGSSIHSDMGVFPTHRAKEKRALEEFCVKWNAVVRIQKLFRSKKARGVMYIRRTEAYLEYIVRRLQSMWRGRQGRRRAVVERFIMNGKGKAAAVVQRRFRAMQAAKLELRRKEERNLEMLPYVQFVQRKYRDRRAIDAAKVILREKRRQRAAEILAATRIQRRYRGNAARKLFLMMKESVRLQKEKERRAATCIQRIYRGQNAKKLLEVLKHEHRLYLRRLERLAIRLQTSCRAFLAKKEVARIRHEIQERQDAATKLQSMYRAKKQYQAFKVMQLLNLQRMQNDAAILLQRHWRGRKDRVGYQLLKEVQRKKRERELELLIHLQRFTRIFLIRLRAKKVMMGLLAAKRHAEEMERWAVTLVQSHWRRRQAWKEVETVLANRRARWKQLVDYENHHGCGYGAPFYYNQLTGEVRWRMPLELLALIPRPKCDQCQTPESASVECRVCGEYFCDNCENVIHGGGNRMEHQRRYLFDYYGVRCDYGDGDFPSEWPSEIHHDQARGYDFVSQTPLENYHDVVWQIQNAMTISTTEPSCFQHYMPQETEGTVLSSYAAQGDYDEPGNQSYMTQETENTVLPSYAVQEDDSDEQGNSLWECFYDDERQEYRYYHRITNRIYDEGVYDNDTNETSTPSSQVYQEGNYDYNIPL